MEVFSDKLKRIRIDKGLTQKKIAKLLEISETGYAGYEQGYREPDFHTLIKICQILDISSDYLLGLENEDGTKVNNNTYNNFGTHQGDVNF